MLHFTHQSNGTANRHSPKGDESKNYCSVVHVATLATNSIAGKRWRQQVFLIL